MTTISLSNQIASNTQAALSGNTGSLATKIKQDAQNVQNDLASGDVEALQEDTGTLVNDTNQAVSTNLLTSSQAGAIQLPAAEAMEGTAVADGLTNGASGALASLFQKYAKNNNLPTDSAHFQASWNQFVNDISNSVPGFNSTGTQATLSAAYSQAAQQAGVSTSTTGGSSLSGGSPVGMAVSSYVQDVVNGNASTAAQFPAQFEQDYVNYCKQNNLNPDSYLSYHQFNQAVQQQAATTLGASSAALTGLKQWDTFHVFSEVRSVVDAGLSSGTVR